MNREGREILQWCGRTLRVTGNSIRKLTRSVSFYILVFYTFLFWYLFTWNIKGVAQHSGYGITPYLLPHFFGSGVFEKYGLLLLVLVTCDAPFLDETRIYSIKRAGKMAWAVGKMIYIAVVNIIFQAVMLIAQMIVLLPYLGFSGGWGSVLYTISKDPSVLQGYSGYGSVEGAIVSNMTPFEACGKQILLCVFLGSLIGVLIFLINGLIGKAVGAVVMAGAILASNFLTFVDSLYQTNYASGFVFKWINLNEYAAGNYEFGRNLACIGGAFLIFAVVSCICVEKNWIRITE